MPAGFSVMVPVPSTVTINIHAFLKRFKEEYRFLYDAHDKVAGYEEAVAWGDSFIAAHPDFVGEFNTFRGDLLTSDREVAAFAFALSSFGV